MLRAWRRATSPSTSLQISSFRTAHWSKSATGVSCRQCLHTAQLKLRAGRCRSTGTPDLFFASLRPKYEPRRFRQLSTGGGRGSSSESAVADATKDTAEAEGANNLDVLLRKEIAEALTRAIAEEDKATTAIQGWSTEWADYPHLLTLLSPGPYFLHLPQLEMIINIEYKIPGTITPVLFRTADASNSGFAEHSLALAVKNPENNILQFYILTIAEPSASEDDTSETASSVDPKSSSQEVSLSVYHLDNVPSFQHLHRALLHSEKLKYHTMFPHPDGDDMLARILQHDPSVAADLYDQGYLPYQPSVPAAVETVEEEMEEPAYVEAAADLDENENENENDDDDDDEPDTWPDDIPVAEIEKLRAEARAAAADGPIEEQAWLENAPLPAELEEIGSAALSRALRESPHDEILSDQDDLNALSEAVQEMESQIAAFRNFNPSPEEVAENPTIKWMTDLKKDIIAMDEAEKTRKEE